jgi:hypothetical protein
MIPNFDDDRINFVRFIQENKDIFYELLESGTYTLTRNLDVKKIKHIYEGYYFFKNFNLRDDADAYSLVENLDDFNAPGETEIQTIINEFQRWLDRDIVKEKFEKEYNKKIEREEEKIKRSKRESLKQIEEMGVRRRTMKKTSHIKTELLNIDYAHDDRPYGVQGLEYRKIRNAFNKRNKNGGMKRKTKKYRKKRHLK